MPESHTVSHREELTPALGAEKPSGSGEPALASGTLLPGSAATIGTDKLVSSWRETGVYQAADLYKLAKEDAKWVVNGLIREGNQIVLSGPPKSGKTILALQLALDVVNSAPCFLLPQHSIESAKKVLFVSFEMRQKAMAMRLMKQTEGLGTGPLSFVFRSSQLEGNIFQFNNECEQVVPTQAGLKLQEIIRDVEPSLIIIDSLVQLHSLDENNNLKMSSLMRMLRNLCSMNERVSREDYERDLSGEIEKKETEKGISYWRRNPIAHVIIHHTRKPPDNAKVYASPEAIRGASAIHSEADLALTLAVPWVGAISLNKSSRELAAERSSYFVISHDFDRLRIVPAPPKNLKKAQVYAQIFNGLKESGLVAVADLHRALDAKGILRDITQGVSVEAFKATFYNKINKAGLNEYQPKRGPGNEARIKIEETIGWEEFAETLLGHEPPDFDWASQPPLPIDPIILTDINLSKSEASSTATENDIETQLLRQSPDTAIIAQAEVSQDTGKKRNKPGRPRGSKNGTKNKKKPH